QFAASVLTITNPNGLTVQNGGTFAVLTASPSPCVITNDVAYQAGGTLDYFSITSPRTTGRELPSAMDGSLRVNGGSAASIITLGANTAINNTGVLDLNGATAPLSTLSATLTVNNSAVGAVLGGSAGYVQGPLRRAIPSGANVGTWLFPVGKGATNLPFSIINPNTSGVSLVEVEAFNMSPGGTGDGTTIQAASISTTEYWRVNEIGGPTFLSGRMQVARTTLAATQTIGSASAVGGPYSAPAITTYNGVPNPDILTQNTAQTLASPNFFAVGTRVIPTTYFYNSGAPHLATSWWSGLGGTGIQAANMTTSGWTFIVPDGVTATATANINLGAAGVTLQVAGGPTGGTLNIPNPFAVTGPGSFQLQAGGTLQTSNSQGVNGSGVGSGAIQTNSISYDSQGSYRLDVSSMPNLNFAAVVGKPPITAARNLTITGTNQGTLATGLALSGALTINCASVSAGLSLIGASAQTLALNGPGSVVQSGRLSVGNNFTLANNNAVTPLTINSTNMLMTIASALPFPIISGQPVNYLSAAVLQYNDIVSGTRNTGAELPPIMNGNVALNTAINSVITIAAPTIINGTLQFFTDSRIVSTPTNLLTIGNPLAGSIIGASATRCITGALARRTSIGGNTHLFPLGGGTAATYIPATFNYSGAGAPTIVTIEGFNSGTPGTPGGGLGSLSATEYWRVNPSVPYSNVTLTFTRNAAIPAGNTLSNSATDTGVYNSVASNVASPSINNLPAFASLAAVDGFYSIASPVVTYYYESGDPAAPGSWGTTSGAGLGTAATNFTTPGSVFVVENTYTTAAASGNISLGASVTMRVLSGGTLNMGTVSLAGTGSFDLQAGGTLRTSRTDGINGISAATGAIQVTGGATYDNAANYWFDDPGAAANLNFAAQGARNAITAANNITFIAPGPSVPTWTLATALNVSGTLNITRTRLSLDASSSSVLQLNGTTNINAQAILRSRANFQVNNVGTMNVNATGWLTL
ncbi:MAG: beta strand repeat-containing protein, partial [Candidatus Kapaibacteriota bacterium]